MSRRASHQVLSCPLNEHPAVQAWRAVVPQGTLPERIEAFCERANWQLYALLGAGPGGSTIIAKRRRFSEASVERAVYEGILPRLSLSVPHYYGCKEDGEFVWLLLQCVDGSRYSESNPEHLAMAARWVAAMHTAGTSLARSTSLPDAGPERYLAHLINGREAIRRSLLISEALDRPGWQALEHVIAQLDRIEAHWDLICGLCEDAPTTLVHGDFRSKNVFVPRDGTSLVAFDWETAGWGPPAPDLTRLDAMAYWQAVRKLWAVNLAAVRRWARVGRVFQTLAAINWEGIDLTFDTPETLAQPVANLKIFGADLVHIFESL